MKKLIIIFLILTILLPVAALSEENDQKDKIVGCWYYSIDQSTLKKEDRLRGMSVEVHILYFDKDGSIKQSDFAFGNSYGLNDSRPTGVVGTWSNSGDMKYDLFYENSKKKAYIEENFLFIEYQKNEYMGFRRLEFLTKDDIRR